MPSEEYIYIGGFPGILIIVSIQRLRPPKCFSSPCVSDHVAWVSTHALASSMLSETSTVVPGALSSTVL